MSAILRGDGYLGIVGEFMIRAKAFTLVEMLLVVSLIVMLIALLLPALNAAREQTRRTVCMANLSQCGAATTAYAFEHGGWLPPTVPDNGTQAHLFRLTTQNYDLRVAIDEFVSGFTVWTCPSVDAAPIDDERNTRFAQYSPYRYYAGRDFPSFGQVMSAPRRLNAHGRSDRRTMMQDVTAAINAPRPWVPVPGGGLPEGAVFNHGAGQLLDFSAQNPSWRFRYADDVSAVAGANILFYDNSCEWASNEYLRDVGFWNGGGTGSDLGTLP